MSKTVSLQEKNELASNCKLAGSSNLKIQLIDRLLTIICQQNFKIVYIHSEIHRIFATAYCNITLPALQANLYIFYLSKFHATLRL